MTATAASGAPVKILVVDDEPGLRLSLLANLELAGFNVSEAPDGASAIEMVRNEAFDMVITDIKMPGINGVDTFRAIKKLRPEMPVMMMTGFAAEDLVKQGLSEGAYTLVHKPFDMEHMIRLIGRAMSRPVVLVVDDEAAQATALTLALQSVGLRAETALDGRSAVEKIKSGNVDVCVLDLVMPEMDGVATYEAIHGLDGNVAVIAMTGHSVPDLVNAIVHRGGYACLRKPFDPGELVRAITRARFDQTRKA